jgi:hypothetical protein
MGVVPFSTSPPYQSVVFAPDAFSLDAPAVLIVNPDMGQLSNSATDCNASYDLRVGDKFKGPSGRDYPRVERWG